MVVVVWSKAVAVAASATSTEVNKRKINLLESR